VKRGDLYLVRKPGSRDPRKQRVFVVVSRQTLIQSRFSSLICAPVYSQHDGLSTQVRVGLDAGLKHDSSIHCDELVSLPKAALTNFVGSLRPEALRQLDQALAVALGLEAWAEPTVT
jgi:mRNA interferase MazF